MKYQVLIEIPLKGVPKWNTIRLPATAQSALAHAVGAAVDFMVGANPAPITLTPHGESWTIEAPTMTARVEPATVARERLRPPTCPSRIRGAPPISGWRSARAAHYIAECPAPPVRQAITFRFMREDGSLIPKSDKQAPLPQRQGEIRAMLPTIYQPTYAPPDAAVVFAFLQGKLLGFRYIPDPR